MSNKAGYIAARLHNLYDVSIQCHIRFGGKIRLPRLFAAGTCFSPFPVCLENINNKILYCLEVAEPNLYCFMPQSAPIYAPPVTQTALPCAQQAKATRPGAAPVSLSRIVLYAPALSCLLQKLKNRTKTVRIKIIFSFFL